MEKLSNSSQFLDIGGLDSLRVKAQKDEKGTLKEAAKQFEGIFIQMLMKSMRDANAAFKSDSPLNSQTTEFFEKMRDQQMSVELSDKGMLGIADLMVQQLDPNSSDVKPASMLRHDFDAKAQQSIEHNHVLPMGPDDDIAQVLPTDAVAVSHDMNMQPHSASPVMTQHGRDDISHLLAGKSTQQNSGNVLPMQHPIHNVNHVDKRQSGFDTPQDFITTLYPHAQKAAKSLGTTPEVLIAQSALETGWGQKVIKDDKGELSNNLFNIKADNRWAGDKTSVNTLEYEQGKAVKQQSDFRVYDSIEQSFNDFVNFIGNSDRYQNAKKVAAQPEQFIHALQKAGYATDPQYANKVIKVMQSVTQSVKSIMPKENN
ncbi:flagellar assembly peptidoglycan hydrolase FlgJ [Shewanella intestini]|uniref:Peptidoglycan hydrolase FlgJ n=1 Tax=Shewanella intestini TaxID=2017544 RepID=A0ABS5I0C0_9GAMM|nr:MULTISPECIES: flagellar assembly peptidoglycan hydrolase FlgJ [Shewanella]MBR9726755.1 flagellar assembly peptidoglycan hydrolase FlgJ [Shewanella intestini]MRG34679.1 flagellar assembly peptidoglycan hydrolase FlgJ [Shewanella sp. XMDDZSB0408]